MSQQRSDRNDHRGGAPQPVARQRNHGATAITEDRILSRRLARACPARHVHPRRRGHGQLSPHGTGSRKLSAKRIDGRPGALLEEQAVPRWAMEGTRSPAAALNKRYRRYRAFDARDSGVRSQSATKSVRQIDPPHCGMARDGGAADDGGSSVSTLRLDVGRRKQGHHS